MGTFIFEKFYLFFQGILIFQVLFFSALYYITKRKEIIYYSLFIFFNAVYFFINAPFTFFHIPDEVIFEKAWYENTNVALLLLGTFFYLKFIQYIFKDQYSSPFLKKVFVLSYISLPLLFLMFFIFPNFQIPRNIIFFTINVINIPAGVITILLNRKSNNGFTWLVTIGILGNIFGTLLTLWMINRYNSGLRKYAIDEYPLLFMRLGIFIDMFCYQLAILKKWYLQETELATKSLQSQLDIAKIKEEISIELHDDIGTSLSKINLQSYLLQKKYANEVTKPILTSIQSEINDTIIRLKDIIWSVEHKESGIQQVFNRIMEYANDVTAPLDIKLKRNLNLLQGLEIQNVKTQYHLYLMSKEIINNAVKHSGCKTITISLTQKNDTYLMQICDDGKGFDINKIRKGNGVDNIYKRSDIIKCKLEVISSQKQGTCYSFIIPKN